MKSKVVLITGASSGIGEATARKLVAEGHKVVVTARRENKLKELAAELPDHSVLAVAADASDRLELENVVNAAVDRFGRLDVVFANAGTGASQPGMAQGDPDEWQSMVDVNIVALLWTAKLTLPHLKQSTGHFIITSSAAGRRAIKGSVYGATKWFAYGFGRNLAEEMAEWQGRCTTICPGVVNTEFFDEPKEDKLQPQDVADAVAYAISAHPRNNVREIYLMPAQ